jgi:hypothetical protein
LHKRLLAALALSLILCATSFAQPELPKFGIGVKASTLGIGVEGATAITKRNNVRVGFNFFNFGYDFDKDGVNYGATLKLHSAQVLLDQYIVGPLHVSPGFMFYNSNKATATANVSAGRTFTLNDRTYRSDAASPVNGSATLNVGRPAPMIMLGIGNLLPRSGRHFTANFEVGVVFQKSPDVSINLAGRGCDVQTGFCGEIMSIPGLPANLTQEQNKISDDLKPFKYYPIVSLGFGYSF